MVANPSLITSVVVVEKFLVSDEAGDLAPNRAKNRSKPSSSAAVVSSSQASKRSFFPLQDYCQLSSFLNSAT
uniref:Uncharacterized protein n=1 Tax=Romanomermis culicivorax TaxID=13658 RepID=A0A915KA95_ROMCU